MNATNVKPGLAINHHQLLTMPLYNVYNRVTESFQQISATAFVLDDFEQFNFIHHTNIDASLEEVKFVVTEASTGCSAGFGATLQEAKENAIENINRVGLEKFKKIIENKLAQYGRAN